MYGCFHRSFIFVVYVCRKEDDGEGESGGAESSRRCCERVDTLLREHRATTIGLYNDLFSQADCMLGLVAWYLL